MKRNNDPHPNKRVKRPNVEQRPISFTQDDDIVTWGDEFLHENNQTYEENLEDEHSRASNRIKFDIKSIKDKKKPKRNETTNFEQLFETLNAHQNENSESTTPSFEMKSNNSGLKESIKENILENQKPNERDNHIVNNQDYDETQVLNYPLDNQMQALNEVNFPGSPSTVNSEETVLLDESDVINNSINSSQFQPNPSQTYSTNIPMTMVETTEVTDEEMNFLLEIENQALALDSSSNLFPVNSITDIPPPNLPNHLHQDVPLESIEPSKNSVYCMRLQVQEIFVDNSCRRKLIQATSMEPRQGSIQKSVRVEIYDDWFDLEFSVGNIFHVIDINEMMIETKPNQLQQGKLPYLEHQKSIFICFTPLTIRITNQFGLVILFPDISITPTRIAESCTCIRRGVLSDRIRSLGIVSSPAVMGHVRHTFMEKLMEEILLILQEHGAQIQHEIKLHEYLSQKKIDHFISYSIRNHVEELYSIQMNDSDVKKDLFSLIKPMVTWIFIAYRQGMNNLTTQLGTESYAHNTVQADDCYVKQLVGIEESIENPILGIKGQVDVIAGGKLAIMNRNNIPPSPLSIDLMLPIEFKSGRWKPSTATAHRAQVILYLLLMFIRQKSVSNIFAREPFISKYGAILYISDQETKVDIIQPLWVEIRALMISRNNLAKSVHQSIQPHLDRALLPSMIQSLHDCSNCYSASECVVYYASLEDPHPDTIQSNPLSPLIHYVLHGINSKHLQYFKHWDRLIDLESLAMKKNIQSHLWCERGLYREQQGEKCLSSLRILSFDQSANNGGRSQKLDIIFEKTCSDSYSSQFSSKSETTEDDLDFQTMAFVMGDRVIISIERSIRQFEEINWKSNTSTTLASTLFDEYSQALMSLQANLCIGIVSKIEQKSITIESSQGERTFLRFLVLFNQLKQYTSSIDCYFRLDKDDLNITINTMRSNLMDLFVEAYNPRLYQDAQKSSHIHRGVSLNSGISQLKSNPSNNNISNDLPRSLSQPDNPQKSNSSTTSRPSKPSPLDSLANMTYLNSEVRKRVRELIVDLHSPTYDSLPPNSPDILLLKPSKIEVSLFYQSIQFLKSFGIDPSIPQDKLEKQPSEKHPIKIKFYNESEIHLSSGLVIFAGCNPLKLSAEYSKLNPEQQLAVKMILLSKDYTLLWGLPGTGKTSTLCLAIRFMIARNETILLTSYTNNAVDHLLLKLLDKGVRNEHVLRIGSMPSLHPRSREVSLENALNTTINSINTFTSRVRRVRLYAATVLTASRNLIFKTMKVDWCIMDEAGQMTQPAALGAVTKARKFVLVGDDCQLAPLVLSKEAIKGGMEISLLKRLMDAHPESICALTSQYRMNDMIMSVCNLLVYQDKMKCGNSDIASARLTLPHLNQLPLPLVSASISAAHASMDVFRNNSGTIPSHLPYRQDWLYQTLLPERAVIFLNTDEICASVRYNAQINRGSSGSSLVENIDEALIVQNILWGFEKTDLSPEVDLAVITPFRAQVQLMKRLFDPKEKSTVGLQREYEVSTVDKYQGKDRDIVIFSTVKTPDLGGEVSNEGIASDGRDIVGQLLRDWKRINVALTRAKLKLIIIGSITMMKHESVLNKLAEFSIQNHWVINLPSNSPYMYQTTKSPSTSSMNYSNSQYPPVMSTSNQAPYSSTASIPNKVWTSR